MLTCLTSLLMFVTAVRSDILAHATMPSRATLATNEVELAWTSRSTALLQNDIMRNVSVSTRFAPVTDEVKLTGTGWFPIALRTDIPRITTVNAQAAPPTDGVKSVCTLKVNFSTNTGEEKIKSGATVTGQLALAARKFTLATDKAFSCTTLPRPQGYPPPLAMALGTADARVLARPPRCAGCVCISTKPSRTELLHSTTGSPVLVDAPATGDAELAEIRVLPTGSHVDERVFDVMCLTTTVDERTVSQATALRNGYRFCFFLLLPLSEQNPNDSWQAICQAIRNVMMHMQNGNMDRVLTPIKRLFERKQCEEAQDTEGGSQPLEEDPPVQELAECEYYMSLRHSTFHHWTPNPQARGINYDEKVYNDVFARVPPSELMADMWSLQPWQHELSDAVTSPHMLVPSSLIPTHPCARGNRHLDHPRVDTTRTRIIWRPGTPNSLY